MANVTGIKKVRVALGSTNNPLALDANGRPDPTVFDTAAYIEAIRGDLSFTYESLSVENDRVSADFGMAPPIPEAGYDADADEYYELRRGQVTLTVQTRSLGVPGVGANIADYDDHPLVMMWKSAGFAYTEVADPADWGDSLDGSGTDNNSGVYTTGDGLKAGDLFQAVVADRAIVRNINWMDSSDTTVHFTPSWKGVNAGSAIPDGSDIRGMATLAPTLDPTPTVHLRLDYDKMAIRCYGCVPSSVTEQIVGEYTIQTTFVFEASQIEFDYSSADVLDGSNVAGRVPRPCGKIAQALDAYMDYSARLPVECEDLDLEDYKVDTAGHFCIQDFTFTVTNTVEMIKCSDNLVGLQAPQITDRDYELSVTITSHNSSGNQNNNPFDGDFLAEARRNYALAFGPHGEGMGHGIFIPAGYLKQSASGRNIDGTFLTQTLVIGADEWYGDNVEEDGDILEGGVAANKKVKIGFTR